MVDDALDVSIYTHTLIGHVIASDVILSKNVGDCLQKLFDKECNVSKNIHNDSNLGSKLIFKFTVLVE